MFRHCQRIKQYVMLRTEAEAFADLADVSSDVETIHKGCASSWWEKSCQIEFQ